MFIGSVDKSVSVIHINKKVESSVFNNYDDKYLFVFFGYAGCTDICTPRLGELSSIYENLKKRDINIKTIFINMKRFRDTTFPQRFAQYFNKDFIGLYLDDKDLYNIQNEFDIYFSPSIVSKGDFEHTSFLFLLKKDVINKNYILDKIYTQVPFNEKFITDDIIGEKDEKTL